MADQKFEIECDESYREIDVRTLLYGIHPDTEPQVIDEIREMKQELKTGQQEIVDTQRVMVENLETTDNPDEIAKPKFRVGENERTEGAALRALYHFLKHVDAHQGLGWSQRNPHARWQSPLALCRASRNLPG